MLYKKNLQAALGPEIKFGGGKVAAYLVIPSSTLKFRDFRKYSSFSFVIKLESFKKNVFESE